MPTFITLTSFLEQLHNPYKIHFVRNKNLDDQLKKGNSRSIKYNY